MTTERKEPVTDWAKDYDIFDPSYVKDPYPVWDELRGKCPVAHTDRWGGSWMPTRFEDVFAIAQDIQHFSSRDILVAPTIPIDGATDPSSPNYAIGAAPIASDPPVHTWSRRLILPSFSMRSTEPYVEHTRKLCRSLIDGFIEEGRADAAVDYAQQIPPRVIAMLLGIPQEMAGTFTNWVRDLLEVGLQKPEVRGPARMAIIEFFREQIADRRKNPGDDLISVLLAAEVDGEPVPDNHLVGTCLLVLVAGIDTTWSSIGSALWHLAQHDDDRRRLVNEPELIGSAVEELLRAYSPVTMARIVAEDVEYDGCQMKEGQRVLMNFPAANRDPEKFPDADKVIIDRAKNPHVAFGAGIHRCAGSNLARMEMRVAIEEWLARIPEYRLENPDAVTWAGGQVRGPRSLPVAFP
ncbi:MAG: cytochrome P450 [Dehalococcoidia bacterium]